MHVRIDIWLSSIMERELEHLTKAFIATVTSEGIFVNMRNTNMPRHLLLFIKLSREIVTFEELI